MLYVLSTISLLLALGVKGQNVSTTADPTSDPTSDPTFNPTDSPTWSPTSQPTPIPTPAPITGPPTGDPTPSPSPSPSVPPTPEPIREMDVTASVSYVVFERDTGREEQSTDWTWNETALAAGVTRALYVQLPISIPNLYIVPVVTISVETNGDTQVLTFHITLGTSEPDHDIPLLEHWVDSNLFDDQFADMLEADFDAHLDDYVVRVDNPQTNKLEDASTLRLEVTVTGESSGVSMMSPFALVAALVCASLVAVLFVR